MKYQEWLNKWIELYIKPISKARTVEHYEYLIEKHIEPYIGDLEIENISSFDLQKLISKLLQTGNKRTNCGLATNTVNSIITILKSSFKTAQDVNKIIINPTDKIKRPKKIEKKVECFTVNEQKNIERNIKTNKKPKMIGILICLYTGLRIGEVLALEWDDVDFEKELLMINKSCYDKKGDKRIITLPKTISSKRIIPLPEKLTEILKEHKKNSTSKWVVQEKSHPIQVRSYQRTFELLLKKEGIAHKGFHALRHTFATRAIEHGMDVRTLSEILGHKNPTITLNLYVHSLLEHKREMMNKIGNSL